MLELHSDSGPIVALKVPSGEVYDVHARLLVQYADYSLRALNSGMKEPSSLDFTLEHHADAQTIKTPVDWVYTKLNNFTDSILNREFVSDGYICTGRVYALWRLADYFQMPQLQNDVMRILYHERKIYIFPYGTSLDGLAKGSKIFDYHAMMLAVSTAQYVGADEHGLLRKDLERQFLEVLIETAIHLVTHHESAADVYELEELLVEKFC